MNIIKNGGNNVMTSGEIGTNLLAQKNMQLESVSNHQSPGYSFSHNYGSEKRL